MKTTLSAHARTVAIVLAVCLVGAATTLASPLCLPPGPADAGVMRAAPEECLFYLGWNGAGKADANSQNQTEQLLAEEEVQTFISEIDRQVTALAQQMLRSNPMAAAFADDLPAIVKGVLTRPAALYVSKAGIGPMGPDMQAGLIVNTGDMQPVFAKAVAQLEAMALAGLPPGTQLQEVDAGGAKLHRAPLPPNMPVVVWGFKDSYFLISVGADAGQELLARLASGSPPAWLAEAQEKAGIDRPGRTWYVNVAGILQAAAPFLADPKLAGALDALGVRSINHLSSVSGFDGTGMASKTVVALAGQPKGVFAALDGEGLTAADLQPIPQDVNFAVAARLDLANVLKQVLETVANIDPGARDEADRGLEQLDAQLGFSLTDDLLAVLGDAWCIYAAAAEAAADADAPAASNVTLSVTVRDRSQFEQAYQALIERLREEGEKSDGKWAVKESKYRGQDVYYVRLKLPQAAASPSPLPFDLNSAGAGLMPCWCLTDERLTICSTPKALKTALTRDPDAPSLAARDELAGRFDGGSGPRAVTYSDTAAGLRVSYPQLQALLPLASAGIASAGLNLQIPALPSLSALESHARPAVVIFEQTDAGFAAESHQTVPIVNSQSMATSGAAIALVLPAVQAARTAARRSQSMNNLRQIALAMHNYADVNKGFPAAASYDDQGQPLLSWRVHILPFIEQRPLYEAFHLDEPWDSEHNKMLIARMPAVYQNPNLALEAGQTSYVAVVGDDAAIQPKKPTTFADITDGTSNTLMAVEADADHAVIWTKPDDWSPDADDPMAGLFRYPRGLLQALFADGHVQPIQETVDAESFKAMLTRAAGDTVNFGDN
ncbi:MAG TPA: DUF1559 domain-containing protein [Pirellulales bacterium]|nr:DUF1559 domain-containing protein [Pirellulales bacterium]